MKTIFLLLLFAVFVAVSVLPAPDPSEIDATD